jgi:predicted metal-dependent peptidase
MPTSRDLIYAAKMAAVDKRPYFAPGIFALVPIEKPGLQTMGVDKHWRMYYDPAILAANEEEVKAGKWSVQQVAGVITHELQHCLRQHHLRFEHAMLAGRPDVANIAQDAAINPDILAEKDQYGHLLTPLPNEPVTVDSLNKQYKGLDLPPNCDAESYYLRLLDFVQKMPESNGQGDGDGKGQGRNGTPQPGKGNCGSCSDGIARPYEDPAPDGTDKSVGLTEAEAEILRREVAMKVIEHAEKSTSRGTMPAGILRWAKDMFHPKVNYGAWIRAALRNAFAEASGNADFTFHRQSRRAQVYYPFVMPGLVGHKVRVLFVIDTSGSMGDDQLAQAMAEVRGFIRQVGTAADLYVMSCDAAAYEVRKVRTVADVRMYGGGGTDMRVPLEMAEQARPGYDLVVLLSDFETPWPDHKPKYRVAIIKVDGSGAPPKWAGQPGVHLVEIRAEEEAA